MNSENHTDNPFSAVLLAAGAGSRLGGRPKALLQLDGVPLIHRLIAALIGAGATELVVVLGHHADAIESVLRGRLTSKPVRIATVTNPRPDEGPATSLRLGLQSLASSPREVMITLCDQPLINVQEVAALMHAYRQCGPAQMLVPRVAGKPGNPVVIDAALRDEWLAGDVHATGQRWRQLHPTRVHWFDSDNEHFRIDIDTSEDLARFNQSTGQTLRWPPP